MRRVVVTGMGIVSSIGNNAERGARPPCARPGPGSSSRREYAELGFRCQVHGAPKIDWEAMVDRRAARFLGKGTAWTTSPWSRPSPIRASRRARSPTSAPASSWARAAPRPGPSSRPPRPRATKGPKRIGPFAVPKAMSSTASATLATPGSGSRASTIRSPRPARPRPIASARLRADPDGQAGHRVRRRRRGARLDALHPVRRHGRHVAPTSTTARQAPAAPMTRDRDGFVIAGGAGVRGARGTGARQGPRREDLRRDRRLRRQLRRLRHGRALGRGRGALHAAGARRRRASRSTT